MWLKLKKVVPEQLIFFLSFVLFMYLIFVQKKMNSFNYELSLRVIESVMRDMDFQNFAKRR